jgi:Ala-tRNA(Pro) deacylase
MTSTSWINEMLEKRGVPYELIQHTFAFTTAEATHGKHNSSDCLVRVDLIVADRRPVQLILPATRRVVLDRVRKLLAADSTRMASETEIERLCGGCEKRSIPPFRRWKGVIVLMDFSMASTRNLMFEAGEHEGIIRLSFQDWFELVSPGVAFFTELIPKGRAKIVGGDGCGNVRSLN